MICVIQHLIVTFQYKGFRKRYPAYVIHTKKQTLLLLAKGFLLFRDKLKLIPRRPGKVQFKAWCDL